MTIGAKIAKIRELKGWTQEELSDKLGMSAAGLGKLERSESDVPFSRLEQVAKVFGMRPEELVAFDEKLVFQNFGTAQGQSFSVNYITMEKEIHDKTLKLIEQVTELLSKMNNK